MMAHEEAQHLSKTEESLRDRLCETAMDWVDAELDGDTDRVDRLSRVMHDRANELRNFYEG